MADVIAIPLTVQRFKFVRIALVANEISAKVIAEAMQIDPRLAIIVGADDARYQLLLFENRFSPTEVTIRVLREFLTFETQAWPFLATQNLRHPRDVTPDPFVKHRFVDATSWGNQHGKVHLESVPSTNEYTLPGDDFIFGISVDANSIIEDQYGAAPVREMPKLSKM